MSSPGDYSEQSSYFQDAVDPDGRPYETFFDFDKEPVPYQTGTSTEVTDREPTIQPSPEHQQLLESQFQLPNLDVSTPSIGSPDKQQPFVSSSPFGRANLDVSTPSNGSPEKQQPFVSSSPFRRADLDEHTSPKDPGDQQHSYPSPSQFRPASLNPYSFSHDFTSPRQMPASVIRHPSLNPYSFSNDPPYPRQMPASVLRHSDFDPSWAPISPYQQQPLASQSQPWNVNAYVPQEYSPYQQQLPASPFSLPNLNPVAQSPALPQQARGEFIDRRDEIDEAEQPPKKRGRGYTGQPKGRPLGAKNKPKGPDHGLPKVPKKKGRPPGAKNKHPKGAHNLTTILGAEHRPPDPNATLVTPGILNNAFTDHLAARNRGLSQQRGTERLAPNSSPEDKTTSEASRTFTFTFRCPHNSDDGPTQNQGPGPEPPADLPTMPNDSLPAPPPDEDTIAFEKLKNHYEWAALH